MKDEIIWLPIDELIPYEHNAKEHTETQIENLAKSFPVHLPAEYILACTDYNDIVTEPFGGSGTTLIACEQLDRRCYIMELEPKYCDVIIQRWENYTGDKAVKVN